MKVLLDECVDRRLAVHLIGFDVRTVLERGWAGITNCKLLTLAATEFDVLITVDRNLPFQQHLPKYEIAVVLLIAKSIFPRSRCCGRIGSFGGSAMSTAKEELARLIQSQPADTTRPAGTFEGSTVTSAPTSRVDDLGEIATEFMFAIFELETDDYLITDESDIRDFISVFESDTREVWDKIQAVYGIPQSDAHSSLLVQLFEIIAQRQSVQ